MTLPDRTYRPAPPRVEDTEEDRNRLQLVSEMAAEIYRRYGHQGEMALTGGGALRLAYGISRPTYDLDIDMERVPQDVVETLQRWCDRSTRWKGSTVDRKQRGRGYIRVVPPEGEGKWTTKIDLAQWADKTSGQGRGGNSLVEGRRLGIGNEEIPVQPLNAIAQRKIEKALGERREGRDLYDLVWLMAKHPEAFDAHERGQTARRICSELANGYDQWEEAVAEDRAVNSVDTKEVLDAAWLTAINEPMVVVQEEGGRVQIRGQHVGRGTADAVAVGRDEKPYALIIPEGRLSETCEAVRRYGLEEPGKVLEIERTLERSLEEARARSREI